MRKPKNKRRSTAERRRIATHEAGHAIAAELLGSTVSRVSLVIDRKLNRWGCCFHSGDVDSGALLMIHFAGIVAEYLESFERGAPEPKNTTISGDVRNARNLCRKVLGSRDSRSQRQRMYADATGAATRLLQQHWPAVVVVSDQLLRRRQIDGDTVRRALSMIQTIPSHMRGTR